MHNKHAPAVNPLDRYPVSLDVLVAKPKALAVAGFSCHLLGTSQDLLLGVVIGVICGCHVWQEAAAAAAGDYCVRVVALGVPPANSLARNMAGRDPAAFDLLNTGLVTCHCLLRLCITQETSY